MLDDIRKFIKQLYPSLGDIGNVAIWSLPGSETRFFNDPGEAATYVSQTCRKFDVYMGMGLLSKEPPRKGRGTIDDIIGIGGFCADIDYGNYDYPPTQEEALVLINDLGLPPTYIFHSGHGLQAWWLFTEVWLFDTPEEKNEAIKKSKLWNHTLVACGRAKGYKVDAVGDLTRVMRLPGTFNYKNEEDIKSVKTIKADPTIRYNCGQFESDFDDYMIDMACANHDGLSNITVDLVTLDPNVEISSQKIDSLKTLDKKFSDTWDRKRKDFVDQSCSTYDMAIANFCAYADWTDQEIANAIIIWRGKHGDKKEKQKALRRDYIMRTILKARTDTSRAKALMSAGNDFLISRDEDGKVDEAGRAQVLKEISDIFTISITGFIQTGRERSIYTIILSNGRQVRVGRARDLRGQKAVWEALQDDSRVVRQMMKQSDWLNVVGRLMQIAEVLDFEDAYTDSDTVIWLGKFLQRRRILKIKIKGSIDMPAGKEPMTMLCEESCLLYIHAESVRGFAIVYENEKISKNEMIDRMRRLHFRRKNITLNWGGNRTTRSYWHRDVDLCKAFMPTNPKFIEQEQEEEVNA